MQDKEIQCFTKTVSTMAGESVTAVADLDECGMSNDKMQHV